MLCQWTTALGATVIGTVSTKEKAVQAKEDGCSHVVIYKDEDFVSRVNEITSGEGVDVVYDSVGRDTFQVMETKFGFQSNCPVQPFCLCEVFSYSGIAGMLKDSWVHGEFWAVVRHTRPASIVSPRTQVVVLD